MTWLLTADLHLSDRPRDDYRFGLFPWLARQQQKHATTATFILGDLTDKKDNHSAALVNRITSELLQLKPPIYILKGNHDYVRIDNPFFEFLNYVDGIEFISEPAFIKSLGVAFLPHQPDQASFDRACGVIPAKPTAIMLHECVEGAIAETGSRLTGISTSLVAAKSPRLCVAGDIHKPQVVNCVTYVGAPYHVRFGDDFEPRVLLVKNGHEQDLSYPCLRKWSLRIHDADQISNDEKLSKGDHVKVVIEMTKEEVTEWGAHKQRALDACRERGLEVFGVTLEVLASATKDQPKLEPSKTRRPEDIVTAFSKAEGLAANIRNAGLEILSS